ncbi:MAG: kinase/pyrophosphorylase [Tissierellia bacterium]|nr:kinase/pyrophosphorylase [Tissierellia bacterium]
MNFDCFQFNERYDDGKLIEDIETADCIILGPSRVGKTPLCYYLGYLGIQAANIPLVPEIPWNRKLADLPRKKIIGLIRKPESLVQIRKTREQFLGLESNYGSLERVFSELEYVQDIYHQLRIAILSMDDYSIEEAAEFIKNRIGK